MSPSRHLGLSAALAAAITVVAIAQAQAPSPRDGDAMQRKIVVILTHGDAPVHTALRTSFTDRELNAYLKFNAKSQIPVGIVDPEVTTLGDGRVTGHAMVDLDVVRKSKERGWLDPMAYLTGSLEVRLTGVLKTANGNGTFTVETATVSGVSIPKSFLQELVSYYSRTPELPQGMDLDKPFALPHGIREVQIDKGAATVIQ